MTAGLLLIAAHPVGAMAKVIDFECHFVRTCSEANECGQTDFNLQFKYDTSTSKAFIIGNAGLSEVEAYGEGPGLSFLERLSSGAIQSTTINLADQRAVHSRHTIIAEQAAYSQFYGRCKIHV
ncbi:hypothetical protein V8J36_13160 [Frigidibacter sp. MR17.14]|uniref:hypothetical protein n=1 Tax=Frigidibacter sp. MR17.14 TaxID=3126509 RepID=UPI003012B544